MTYDFDRKVDRKSTNDMKWHAKAVSMYLHREIPETMIPMWLADTEFACPPCIVKAVEARAAKEIFGYCAPMESYYAAVCGWQKRRHNWDVSPAWVTQLPSVVAGINIAIRAFSQPGDGVIIQQPVYDPFATIVQQAGRVVVNNALVETGHGFEMNFDELARLAAKPENKIMVLCSPHNPVGRVWSREELLQVGRICQRHGVTVFSDEIHADFVWQGKHQVFAAVDPAFAAFTITATAPSKTFNIAGLQVSNIFIADEALRAKFRHAYNASGYSQLNAAGLVAAEAAYRGGETWYNAVKAYVVDNIAYMREFITT
uniref:MalY/PatB family protein n=1 Tax=Candidatus Allofournierella excrementavium TaxID=2838591 RepID=UPI003AB8A6D3